MFTEVKVLEEYVLAGGGILVTQLKQVVVKQEVHFPKALIIMSILMNGSSNDSNKPQWDLKRPQKETKLCIKIINK